MKVYVITAGMWEEEFDICAVTDTEEKAKKLVKAYDANEYYTYDTEDYDRILDSGAMPYRCYLRNGKISATRESFYGFDDYLLRVKCYNVVFPVTNKKDWELRTYVLANSEKEAIDKAREKFDEYIKRLGC